MLCARSTLRSASAAEPTCNYRRICVVFEIVSRVFSSRSPCPLLHRRLSVVQKLYGCLFRHLLLRRHLYFTRVIEKVREVTSLNLKLQISTLKTLNFYFEIASKMHKAFELRQP